MYKLVYKTLSYNIEGKLISLYIKNKLYSCSEQFNLK